MHKKTPYFLPLICNNKIFTLRCKKKGEFILKKFIINSLVLSLLVLSVFSFPNQVNAIEKDSGSNELNFQNYNMAESLTENEKELLKNEVQRLNENANALTTQADKSEIDFSNPNFTKLIHKETQENVYSISFEIIGENHTLSSIDVVYDSSLNIKYQKEIHIKDYNGSDVSLDTWFNNKKVASIQDTKENLEAKVQNQMQSESNQDISTYASGGKWGCIKDCLSNAGFSMWLIGLVGTICSAACIVTVGAGCAPCLVGLGMAQVQVFFDCQHKCTAY